MKLFIVTGEPFPNGMAATNRIKCYARAIEEGGLDCEVIIFRRTEIFGVKPKNTEGRGVFDGIPFRFIGDTPLRGSNVLKRQIDDHLDVLRTENYLKHNIQKGDVLFLYMGLYIDQMFRLMKVAHSKGAFCVRDLCELPYGTGKETEKTIRLRKRTLEKQFPKLDGIISISDALLNLARTYSSPFCKHIKIPILVDFDKYNLPNHSAEAEVPYIFHAGTLYEQKDGILGMIEAFGKAVKRLSTPIRFVATGNLDNSPHKEAIISLIKEYQLADRFQLTGYISDNELKDYLSKATAVIINKKPTQQNIYCFSTKLGEYLAAGKPVIMTDVGEAMNWLSNNKSAYIIEKENSEALTDAIVRVFSEPVEARGIGQEGRRVCQNSFDYRVWGKPMVSFFESLGNEV